MWRIYISGEVKVALTLRYLAGASYLDLFMAYHIEANTIGTIIGVVIQEWICHPKVYPIDFYNDVMLNPTRLEQVSRDFSRGSGWILRGCFGAIDGWLVKIKCPTLDEVANPGKYMSRKVFFL